MPVFVVDASVAVKWLVREPDTDAAAMLLDEPSNFFIAPALFPAEVVNAILKRHRDGRLSDAVVDRILARLDVLLPDLVPLDRLLPAAIGLARRLRHPIYDCFYLALADQRAVSFITADETFVERCRSRLPGDPVLRHLSTLSAVEHP